MQMIQGRQFVAVCVSVRVCRCLFRLFSVLQCVSKCMSMYVSVYVCMYLCPCLCLCVCVLLYVGLKHMYLCTYVPMYELVRGELKDRNLVTI